MLLARSGGEQPPGFGSIPPEGDPVDAPRDIGARIREARKAARLTQEQLAELAGTSTRTVRDIEKGTGATSLGVVARVAEALGLRLMVDR